MPRSGNNTAPPWAQAPPRGQTLEILTALHGASEEVRPALLAHLHQYEPGVIHELVEQMLTQQRDAQNALAEADRALAELQQIIEDLTRPPLLEAGLVAIHDDGTCLVSLGGNTRQEVAIHPDVCLDDLQVGDTVALAQDGHVVVKPLGSAPRGRVATVQGYDDGELLVEYQSGLSMTATPAAAVAAACPKPGDRVLVHEGWQIALKVLPRETDQADDDTFDPVHPDQLGGLDDQIEEILTAVEARLLEPERAVEIGMAPLGGLVLEGPPGTGKTLLARALATFLAADCGRRVRFINVAPGAWRDPYYGVSDHKVVEPILRAQRLLDEG
jgi:proteasome-associated ATPase